MKPQIAKICSLGSILFPILEQPFFYGLHNIKRERIIPLRIAFYIYIYTHTYYIQQINKQKMYLIIYICEELFWRVETRDYKSIYIFIC